MFTSEGIANLSGLSELAEARIKSGASLPRKYDVILLRLLARDDQFREKFQNNPASALAEIGVEAEIIACLDPACRDRRSLASKSQFEQLLGKIDEEALAARTYVNGYSTVGFRRYLTAKSSSSTAYPKPLPASGNL